MTFPANAQEASFQGLGDIRTDGTTSSWAHSVSGDGSTIVGQGHAIGVSHCGTTGACTRAFRWTEGGGLVSLGGLGTGNAPSVALAVSEDGSVVAGWASHQQKFSEQEAFRWTETGGMQGLGDLPGGEFNSHALGVSADGSVIVGFGTYGTSSQAEAFRWTAADGMVGLGFLRAGDDLSRATDVSADGSVIVGFSTGSGRQEAFRWTAETGMVAIGDLPGGDFSSAARDVSPDGSIVVGGSSSANGFEAFRWTAETGMVGLGDLPGGDFYSGASATTADGSIIVGTSHTENGYETFIWTAERGMRLLKTVLEADYGLDLSGWVLESTVSISDDGIVLAGRGINPNGRPEAWRAVLACPANECECATPERVWVDESLASFMDAAAWEEGAVPSAEEIARFPERGQAYAVVTPTATLGSIAVEGDVNFLGATDQRITLTAPCGDALVLEGRPLSDTTGSRLHLLTFLEVEAMGDVRVPRSPGTLGDLILSEESQFVSDAAINAYFGVSGSGATVTLQGQSTWDTPSGDVHTGTGWIELVEASRFRARRLFLAEGTGSTAVPVFVKDGSVLEADSILAGRGLNGGVLLADAGTVTVKGLVTAQSSPFHVAVDAGALVEAEEAVIGEFDSSSVTIRDGAFNVEDVLRLGHRAGGVGVIDVQEDGSLSLGSHTDVGRGGAGTIRVRPGAEITNTGGPGVVFMGSEEEAAGTLVLDGMGDDPFVDDLSLSWLVAGLYGTGTIDLIGFVLHANDIILGGLKTGEGTLTLRGASVVESERLVVGGGGRGHLSVENNSALTADRLVLADSTGGFGSMHVADSASVGVEALCVGCYDGVGILGVDGVVLTDVLQIGPLGTVHGKVHVFVRTITTNKSGSNGAESGIVTGALYLARESTVEVDSIVVEGGTLGGTYTWQSDFTNRGTLSPGDSTGAAGTFRIEASYEQTSEGVLEIELGGLIVDAEHDALEVAGSAALDGTLRIRLIDGFSPQNGQSFTILRAASVSGAFAALDVEPEIELSVAYTDTTALLTVLSGVAVDDPPAVPPRAFALEQNYPNPFNPRTTIAFELPQASDVLLAVYDLLGREVKRLVEGRYPAGRHEVGFEAGHLPSGVYVYRLRAGDFTDVKTLLLLR